MRGETMKKTYSKPEIMFEDFTLAVNIAAGCEKKINNPSQGACGVPTSSGETIFTDAVCDYTPGFYGQAEDQWDGFCYHVPSEGSNIFNS